LFWGGPLEIVGWIVAGLLLVVVLVFIFLILTGKKITILDELRAAVLNKQGDENAIEGSLETSETRSEEEGISDGRLL
jgi:hypothetical protein